jgi:membrane-bound serine protease (ClpP class)
LVAEVKVTSYGLLTLGGVIALTLGSLMLVETPEPALRISTTVILPTVATLAAIVLFVLQRAVQAQTQRVATGPQGLVGEIGVATTALNPEGKVFVHGELWDAVSATPARQGDRVRVVGVKGLRLTVEQVS